MDFYLYDEYKEMTLREFCEVCKLPFPGFIEEPHRNDVEGFIDTIAVGETRKVSNARITSIHFPVLRYFAIFASGCLIGRGNCGNLSAPDIVILCHALFRDDTFSMGAIVAKRLNLNRTKGPVLGGIFASRLAAHFNIPIRHYEKEEKLLPPIFIFASGCLIGRGNCGNLSAPDIVILCHALFRDDTFSMGAIVAKRLNLNRTKGPVLGGIFASRLAAHFNIPIRHYEKEEKLLPPIFLDYKSMVAHEFIVKIRR